MKIINKLKSPLWPSHPKIARWLGYGSLVLAAAIVGRFVNSLSEIKAREQSRGVIARQLVSFSELEKEKVDKINTMARQYVHNHNLAPGQPLPPKAVLNPKPGSLMDTDEASRLMTSFMAKDGQWQVKASSLISIANTVPQKGEKYAYVAMEMPLDVLGYQYDIHPKDSFAFNRMMEATKIAAEKFKETKN